MGRDHVHADRRRGRPSARTQSRRRSRSGDCSQEFSVQQVWRPQRDSNPRFSLERAASWASGRWGRTDKSRAQTGCREPAEGPLLSPSKAAEPSNCSGRSSARQQTRAHEPSSNLIGRLWTGDARAAGSRVRAGDGLLWARPRGAFLRRRERDAPTTTGSQTLWVDRPHYGNLRVPAGQLSAGTAPRRCVPGERIGDGLWLFRCRSGFLPTVARTASPSPIAGNAATRASMSSRARMPWCTCGARRAVISGVCQNRESPLRPPGDRHRSGRRQKCPPDALPPALVGRECDGVPA